MFLAMTFMPFTKPSKGMKIMESQNAVKIPKTMNRINVSEHCMEQKKSGMQH